VEERDRRSDKCIGFHNSRHVEKQLTRRNRSNNSIRKLENKTQDTNRSNRVAIQSKRFDIDILTASPRVNSTLYRGLLQTDFRNCSENVGNLLCEVYSSHTQKEDKSFVYTIVANIFLKMIMTWHIIRYYIIYNIFIVKFYSIENILK